MAVHKPVGCQWYQTEGTVAASFKLRPSETRGKVTAEFREDYCAVYDGGRLIAWVYSREVDSTGLVSATHP